MKKPLNTIGKHCLSLKKPMIIKNISYVYNNLGNNYTELKIPDSAIYYFRKALKLRKELQNPTGIASTCDNIGQYFQSVNQLDSAIYYHKLAGDNYRIVKDLVGIAISAGFFRRLLLQTR